MPSILEALTQENVTLDSDSVSGGSNTTTAAEIRPENWNAWKDFNYATLTRIYREQLDSRYVGSPRLRALVEDLEINNEETLHDALIKFVIPVVNYALEDQNPSAYLGRGSRCSGEGIPDWSVTSPERIDYNKG